MDRYPYLWYTILLGATRALAHIGVHFIHRVFGLSLSHPKPSINRFCQPKDFTTVLFSSCFLPFPTVIPTTKQNPKRETKKNKEKQQKITLLQKNNKNAEQESNHDWQVQQHLGLTTKRSKLRVLLAGTTTNIGLHNNNDQRQERSWR